jgi:hypothetical protein
VMVLCSVPCAAVNSVLEGDGGMFHDTNIPYDRYVPLNEANLT